MKYASIVPLIGGETIAMEKVFGKRPESIFSYSAFKDNDMQLLRYYNMEVPYYLIDKGEASLSHKLDVVNAVCPCAGLSSLSPSANSDSKTNDWMIESAEYVLRELRPKVFWGENAPRLASKMGEPIVEKLRKIGKKYGYTFSLYKTKSILHGLSQVRDRSFYFFWKDTRTPILSYFRREHESIEDTIRSAKNKANNVLTNDKIPTRDPFYRYVLEVLCEGQKTHAQFMSSLDITIEAMTYIEKRGIGYDRVANWCESIGEKGVAARCIKYHDKLFKGGNIMRKGVTLPKKRIGAFVGHLPTLLTHPDEDRFLTIDECLHIMGMPSDFVLQGGRSNVNMICQNVPVSTAVDMAEQVKAYLQGNLQYSNADFLIQDNKTKTMKPTAQLNI